MLFRTAAAACRGHEFVCAQICSRDMGTRETWAHGIHGRTGFAAQAAEVFGSPGRTRTSDPAVNSRLLYQLSYRGIGQSNLRFLRGLQHAWGISDVERGCHALNEMYPARLPP